MTTNKVVNFAKILSNNTVLKSRQTVKSVKSVIIIHETGHEFTIPVGKIAVEKFETEYMDISALRIALNNC